MDRPGSRSTAASSRSGSGEKAPIPPVFGPEVAVAEALVVACRRQRDRSLTVAHRDDGRLAADEPLLDDERRAPGPAGEERRRELERLLERVGRR